MPEKRLVYKPGINLIDSPTAVRDGWVAGNLMRFRHGYPEKLLGWQHQTINTVSSAMGANVAPAADLPCIARRLHFWSDLTGNSWLAVGTNLGVAILEGATLFSLGAIGLGPSSSAPSKPFSLVIWSLDNFGQDLVAARSGGTIYSWVPQSPPGAGQLTAIANAPAVVQGMFVAMQQQMIVAYGCTPTAGGTADPMQVRWCDAGDFTSWTASATNQAGAYRLPRGNRIVGGIQTPNAGFLFTDFAIWAMQYIGFPLVWGFTEITENCGLIAQNAVVVAGSVPYWMSDHGFFRLGSGGAEYLPCPVWDFVYKNLDENNQDKCMAGLDFHYNEVFFFFPSLSGATGEIDSYVKYNFVENVWDTGSLVRTAWTDTNRPGPPLAIDGTGLLQQHDTGFDADGTVMSGVYLQSGYTDISDGSIIALVNRLIPDFSVVGSMTITLYFRNYPGDTPTVAGPYKITETTELITLTGLLADGKTPTTGIRAREVAIRIQGDGFGTWFRMGVPRARIQPDGRL